MKTVNTLFKDQNFTPLEIQVMGQLNEELKGNFGETYSHVECKDLAKALSLEVSTIKGVVGSLVKKGILDTYDGRQNRGDAPIDLVHFKDQETMDYEALTIQQSEKE